MWTDYKISICSSAAERKLGFWHTSDKKLKNIVYFGCVGWIKAEIKLNIWVFFKVYTAALWPTLQWFVEFVSKNQIHGETDKLCYVQLVWAWGEHCETSNMSQNTYCLIQFCLEGYMNNSLHGPVKELSTCFFPLLYAAKKNAWCMLFLKATYST